MTDFGDQIGWWKVRDFGDKSRHQHHEMDTNITYTSSKSSGKWWFESLTNIEL